MRKQTRIVMLFCFAVLGVATLLVILLPQLPSRAMTIDGISKSEAEAVCAKRAWSRRNYWPSALSRHEYRDAWRGWVEACFVREERITQDTNSFLTVTEVRRIPGFTPVTNVLRMKF